MKSSLPSHLRAFGLCAAVLISQMAGPATDGQGYDSAEAQLVGKARTLEARGRLEMARSVWRQVLLIDPKNTEALAALARVARQEGHAAEATGYLNQLRAIDPKNPNLAVRPAASPVGGASPQLDEAERLARAGDPAQAMVIYRQMYGATPPAGDVALAFYETEAATDDGRPHAIAGLRALADRFPAEPRYRIALGRILTYNPRTRAEGRKLLEGFPSSPEAMTALRQAVEWDSTGAATTVARSSVPPHEAQRQVAQAAPPPHLASAEQSHSNPAGPVTPQPQVSEAHSAPREQPLERVPSTRAAPAIERVRTERRPTPERVPAGDDALAYKALKARRFAEAEWRFKSILQRSPRDAQALAGLGYAQMNEGNPAAAVTTLERAKAAGAQGYAVGRALGDARFEVMLQAAVRSLSRSDLAGAQKQFTAALQQRPSDPGALQGLGNTLLKEQQSRAAAKVFADYTLLRPSDPAGWRGLLMAEVAGDRIDDAARTQARIPAVARRDLVRDPGYLRTVLAIDTATGNAADTPWVLNATLDLPFPSGGRALKPDQQLQYAALLSATGLKAQATALYRQVLNAEPTSVDAWTGLILLEHETGQDPAAYAAIHALTPAVYGAAIMDPVFVTTEAEIDESQDHPAAARASLEALLAREAAQGNTPFAPAQVQLAELYRRNGELAHAYPLYRAVLMQDPQRVDAWAGLIEMLHATGHDPEALTQWQQIQPAVRTQLESDPVYLQTLGLIYASTDQPEPALRELSRVQQHYAALHRPGPPELEIEVARVLYRLSREQDLYHELLGLGSRADLTDAQRLSVQTIWADWAVRKAETDAAAGLPVRGAAVLTAAADAFPLNPTMARAVRESYGSNGLATKALGVRGQDTMTTSVPEFKAIITAALATHDLKTAEGWVHTALVRYPKDAAVLVLAGKYEMGRGRSKRALEYFRASLAAPAPPDPGTELVRQLGQPATQVAPAPSSGEREALATLLVQPGVSLPPTTSATLAHPYLPSYAGRPKDVEQARSKGTEPRAIASAGAPAPHASGHGFYTATLPGGIGTELEQAEAAARGSTVRDYVPQSRLEPPKGLTSPARSKSGA